MLLGTSSDNGVGDWREKRNGFGGIGGERRTRTGAPPLKNRHEVVKNPRFILHFPACFEDSGTGD